MKRDFDKLHKAIGKTARVVEKIAMTYDAKSKERRALEDVTYAFHFVMMRNQEEFEEWMKRIRGR